MRFLSQIKNLDDPERPTPYALHAMITREVEEAIAEEREACAKIVDLAQPSCGIGQPNGPALDPMLVKIAAAIRARA